MARTLTIWVCSSTEDSCRWEARLVAGSAVANAANVSDLQPGISVLSIRPRMVAYFSCRAPRQLHCSIIPFTLFSGSGDAVGMCKHAGYEECKRWGQGTSVA
jgi:hypothetical protein